VLACVIGTLVLLITATATSQVASGGVDLERYEHLEQEIEANRKRLAEFSAVASELEELASKLEETHARGIALEHEGAAVREAIAQHAPLLAALREDESRVWELERELAPHAEASASGEKALAARKKRLLSSARIRLKPSGSGYGLDPHFVECRPEGIIYYEGLERRGVEVPTHHIAGSAGYRRFLRAAVFRTNASVIFLIRQGGVDACEWAGRVARQHRLRSGRMPLVGAGALDFSAMSG
jgi:hypothetical protein